MAQALQLLISGFAQACGPDFAVKAMNEAAEARATQRWRLRRESPNFLAQDLALGINPGERNR